MDIRDALGMSISTLQAIELGKKRSGGAKLRAYFKYADYLGVPLSDLFLKAVERRADELRIKTTTGKYFIASEDGMMERIQEAIHELEISGKPFSRKAICTELGIKKTGLNNYDRVQTFVGSLVNHNKPDPRSQDPLFEEKLLEKAEVAIHELTQRGKPITHLAVSTYLDISQWEIILYPQVKKYIGQFVDYAQQQQKHAKECELTLLEKVRAGVIELNARVNYASITREMGRTTARTLKTYPKVRMLVDEYLRLDHHIQLHQFALREEQLLNMIKAAIEEIEALGEPVTQRELLIKVGKNRTTLRSYPRVNAFIEQKITRHHVYQQRREQPEEEELVQRVNEALADLTEQNEHITLTKVAHKVHYSPNVLMQYPRVALIVEQNTYNRQEMKLKREKELLTLIKDAIDTCRQNAYPITKESISFHGPNAHCHSY